MNIKDIFKITAVPVVAASLCCLSPVIILLAGVGTVGFASSLADTLYGDYRWFFRIGGLILLAIALIIHFRGRGICTLDAARRNKNEIINTILITIFASILAYIMFLYGVVEWIGIYLDVWETPDFWHTILGK